MSNSKKDIVSLLKEKKAKYLLWPTLPRLHSKQREHGGRNVVVVEALCLPGSLLHRRQGAGGLVREIWPSES